MKDFVTNPKLLEETVSDKDYFDLSNHTVSISNKINRLNQSSIIGIVADYGKGKSTLIKQIQKHREKEDETWVEFEAWKVPGRKELWETFVIDMARQIDNKAFREAILKLDGKQNDDKKVLVNTLADIPGFKAIKNINHFFDTSPARRVFEIQEILKEVIREFPGRKLVVVIEDVDRSGEQGIFFIETLKQFIRETEEELEKKLLIILPISGVSFFDKEESYLKSLDVIEFFEHKEYSYELFLREVLREDIADEVMVKQLSDFFILLSREHPGTTMRKIKLILRKARISYQVLVQEGYQPDWRVCIAIEAARFFRKKDSECSILDSIIENGRIEPNSIFGVFLYTISKEGSRQQLIRNNGVEDKILDSAPSPFKFHKRPDNNEDTISNYPSIPYFPDSFMSKDGDSGVILDFYLRH